MTREQDLGRLLQQVGRRMEDRGQVTSQRFHDWRKDAKIEADSTRGGGGVEGDVAEKRADRAAARLHKRWTAARLEALRAIQQLDALMDAAEVALMPSEKHRTPTQVEADGWCGNHWARIGVLEPVSLRPSGEPWYKGRCRFCGAEGDPPAEILSTRHAGKAVRVAAS